MGTERSSSSVVRKAIGIIMKERSRGRAYTKHKGIGSGGGSHTKEEIIIYYVFHVAWHFPAHGSRNWRGLAPVVPRPEFAVPAPASLDSGINIPGHVAR